MSKKKKISQPIKVLIALFLGAIAGFIFGEKVSVIEPIGQVFLRLLKMTIVPLVFFSITSGVSGISDMQRLKKVGITFIKFWAISSILAAVVGSMTAYVMNPGQGIDLPPLESAEVEIDLLDNFINWIPENPIAAFAEGDFLQIIVFAMFTGISIVLLGDNKAAKVISDIVDAGSELMGQMVSIVLNFSPYGVFALMANVTGTLGSMVLVGIGKMLLTQYVAYAIIILIVYPIILKVFTGVNPVQHYRNIFPAMVLAFSTQSSSAALPVTMSNTRDNAGVPGDIVNLIAAPAATINMQACAAEMPIYAIFAAQIYGLNIGFLEFVQIVVLGVVMAAGVGGVPGGGIMMSAVLLEIMGLPLDIVSWIAGVYLLIDMPNTMLNITGDTVGMVYTAEKLGELDHETFNAKVEY